MLLALPLRVPQLQGNSESYGLLRSSYSINMPQYSTPPVEGVFQVSVKNLAAQEESSPSGGAAGGMSDPLEKRRTISLPDECRESPHKNAYLYHGFPCCHGDKMKFDLIDTQP